MIRCYTPEDTIHHACSGFALVNCEGPLQGQCASSWDGILNTAPQKKKRIVSHFSLPVRGGGDCKMYVSIPNVPLSIMCGNRTRPWKGPSFLTILSSSFKDNHCAPLKWPLPYLSPHCPTPNSLPFKFEPWWWRQYMLLKHVSAYNTTLYGTTEDHWTCNKTVAVLQFMFPRHRELCSRVVMHLPSMTT
jgi:hypothetical protein